MTNKLILASNSQTRQALLKDAGVKFSVQGADIDERKIEDKALKGGVAVEQMAFLLAESKACAVSLLNEDSYIIGADQILVFKGKILHKVRNRDEAKEKLRLLRGQEHSLISAVCLVRNQKTIATICSRAKLTMRDFSDEFLNNYLNEMSDSILSSVGCYQIEAMGVQLFRDIEGDIFTIMGLPLLPLLEILRNEALLET